MKTVFFELYLILNSWVAGFTNHLTLGVCNFSHVTGDFNAISCMIISFMNISRPKYIFTPFILIFSGYLNTFGFKADNCHFSCDNFSSQKYFAFWAYLEHSWWINRWLPNWKTKLVLMTKRSFEMAFIVKLLPLYVLQQLPQ